MNLLITGSTGYIGQYVVQQALACGHKVIEACRKKPNNTNNWIYYDLNGHAGLQYGGQIDAIIHLAIDTSGDSLDGQEDAACMQLQKFAKSKGARFIYISSQAANEDAPTSYGRIKWIIEKNVLINGGFVVRLGQVYGGAERGLFGILTNVVRKLPVIPAFIPKPMIQPIHVEDSARGLLTIAIRESLPAKSYKLADQEPLPFTAFLKAIATHKLGVKRLYFPVPTFAIRILVKVLGQNLSDKIGLSRLLSLFSLQPMATKEDLELINLSLRPLSSGMNRRGITQRRLIIQEGSTLLKYILKRDPPSHLVRRYVRVIDALKNGEAMMIGKYVHRFPVLLSAYNSKTSFRNLFWRLNAAMVVAEASPQGAIRFLGHQKGSFKIIAFVKMGAAITKNALWLILGIAVSPILKHRNSSQIL